MRALALALVAACSAGPVAPSNRGGGSAATGSAECRADDDCTLVETQCCDHCNGGKLEAASKQRAASLKPTDCAGTTCTRRGCTGGNTAGCVAGVCKKLIDI